jgi:hypothetical protein
MSRWGEGDDESEFDDPRPLSTSGAVINIPVVIGAVVVMTLLVATLVVYVNRSKQAALETEAQRVEHQAAEAAANVLKVHVAPAPRLKPEPAPTPPVKPEPAAAVPQLPPPIGPITRTKPPATAPRGRPGENWDKAIGTWRRELDVDKSGYPLELEMRKDFTARSLIVHRDGRHVIHETLVEVLIDQNDRLSLILHIERGQYSYSFTLHPDGKMILHGIRDEELVFVRVK